MKFDSSSNLDTYIRISPFIVSLCICHLRAKGADATYSADALKAKDVIAVDGPMDASTYCKNVHLMRVRAWEFQGHLKISLGVGKWWKTRV